MSGFARKPKVDPVREALARAPVGGPLIDEERERDAEIRSNGLGDGVPHAEAMRLLDVRLRRGS